MRVIFSVRRIKEEGESVLVDDGLVVDLWFRFASLATVQVGAEAGTAFRDVVLQFLFLVASKREKAIDDRKPLRV